MTYRAVDPLTGKSIGLGNYKPRPELEKRLAEQVQRKTSEGTFKTGADGRTTFVPKFIEEAAAHAVTAAPLTQFKPGDRARVIASAAELHEAGFSAGFSAFLAGREVVIEEEARCGFGQARHLVSFTYTDSWGDSASVRAVFLSRIHEAEGDDEREAMGLTSAEAGVLSPSEAAREFDPFAEPLGIGDYVECVREDSMLFGCRGEVDQIDGTWVHVLGLGGWDADHRHFLKLIAKA
jgi:hypothetical protein